MIQGAGAAVLLPLTLTLISEAFPAEKRGVAIGMWGGVTGLGVAAGPVLGGAVTKKKGAKRFLGRVVVGDGRACPGSGSSG